MTVTYHTLTPGRLTKKTNNDPTTFGVNPMDCNHALDFNPDLDETDYNAILDQARSEGLTYTALDYEGSSYAFKRFSFATGWDACQTLPSKLWSALRADNIVGGMSK